MRRKKLRWETICRTAIMNLPSSAPSAPVGLMLFTRYPEPGRTKTRLISRLGAEGAAALQRAMTEYVLRQVAAAAGRLPLALEVHFDGGTKAQMQSWLGTGTVYYPQGEGDLGARLETAFRQNFAAGRSGAIAIGSDCPALGSEHLAAAIAALQRADVVLGPATDGGYYLIGLSRPQPVLFDAIAWGTGEVLAQTLAAATAQGLTVALLTPLTDVDLPEDLPQWEQILASATP